MRNFISFYADSARIAVQSIFAHKLRAFLTLIGIIIGVASVVVVGASINGFNSYVVEAVAKAIGVNHFMIARMARVGDTTVDEWERMDRRNKRLYIEDYEWVLAHCTSCNEVGAQMQNQVDLKQEGHETFGTDIAGVTANMAEIENKTIGEGRYIAPHEVEHSANVAVIGYDVREKFFLGVDPIGKTIKVKELPMTIVGVEAQRGSFFGQSMDNCLYIPLTTYGKIFGRRQSLQIHGKSNDKVQLERAIEEARLSMRNRHRLIGNEDDDFGLVNVDQVNSQIDEFTGAIALVVTPITLLSLVVGGIVVMNIMLVSVTERTFEIGLRKAVGARSRQILMQFLIESSVLSSVGGVFGLLLAWGVALIIRLSTPIPMTITAGYILLSLLVSGGIGMIFGIYPAFKASRLDPIVALTKS